jgi:hypothetical protein
VTQNPVDLQVHNKRAKSDTAMADYETFDLGDWKLQSGDTLSNAFLAYKTFGDPKLPAIVYPTWYSGCTLALRSRSRKVADLPSNIGQCLADRRRQDLEPEKGALSKPVARVVLRLTFAALHHRPSPVR